MEKFYYAPGIGNYYGGLNLKQIDNKYYWGIENYDGIEWDEIPQNIFEAIIPICKEYFED